MEVNPQTSRVRATAIGSMEMRAQDMMTAPDAEECRKIAATSMNLPVEKVELVAGSTLCTVYQGLVEERKFRFFKTTRRPIRVLDRQGFVKVQRSDGSVYQYTGADAAEGLKQSWEQLTIYNGDSIIFPDLFMIAGSHIMDLSGVQSVEHALGLVGTDLAGVKADEPIVVVGTRGARGSPASRPLTELMREVVSVASDRRLAHLTLSEDPFFHRLTPEKARDAVEFALKAGESAAYMARETWGRCPEQIAAALNLPIIRSADASPDRQSRPLLRIR